MNASLSCGSYGTSLAAAAQVYDNLDLVKYLVKRSADVNLPINCGEFGIALAAAINSGTSNGQTAMFLIDCGADVNLPSRNGH